MIGEFGIITPIVGVSPRFLGGFRYFGGLTGGGLGFLSLDRFDQLLDGCGFRWIAGFRNGIPCLAFIGHVRTQRLFVILQRL